MNSPSNAIMRILNYRKISAYNFAREHGIDFIKFKKILNNEIDLDFEMCQILEASLGFKASYWASLQQVWTNERNK